VTIGKSEVNGLGLFAIELIPGKRCLGRTHTKVEIGIGGPWWLRSPMGGLYNESDNPNCYTTTSGSSMHLWTHRDIQPGEEITAKYTLYDRE